MGVDAEVPLAHPPARHSVGVSEPREGKLARLTGSDKATRRGSTGRVNSSDSPAARRAPVQPRDGEASRRESTLELAAFLRGTGPAAEPSGQVGANYEDGLPPVAPANAVRKRSGFFKLPIAIQTSIGIGGFSSGNTRSSSAQSPPSASKFEEALPAEHLTKRVLPNGRSYLTTGSLSGLQSTGSIKSSRGILRHKASGSSSITPSVSSLSASRPVTKPGRPRSATCNAAAPVPDLLQLLREGPDAAQRPNGTSRRRAESAESGSVPAPQRQTQPTKPDPAPREEHLEREEVLALPLSATARTFAPSDFGRAVGGGTRRRERTPSGNTGLSDDAPASFPKREGWVYGADVPSGLPYTPPLSREQLCGSETGSATARTPAQSARLVNGSLLLATGHVPAGFELVPAPPRSPSNNSPRPPASTHSAPLAPGEGEDSVPRAAVRRFGSSPWAPATSDRTFGSGMSDTAPTSEGRSSSTTKRASLMYEDMAAVSGLTPAQRSSKRASSSWLTEEEHAELVSELKRVEAATRSRPKEARPTSAGSTRWEERKRQSIRLMPAGAVGAWHKEGPLPALDLAPSPGGLPAMPTPGVDGALDTLSRGPSPAEQPKGTEERRLEAPSPLPDLRVLARGVPKHAVFVARRSSSLPDAAAVAQALAVSRPSSLEPIKHSSTLAMRMTSGSGVKVQPKPAAQHAQQHRLSAVLAASNESAQAGARRSSQSPDQSTSELTAALQAAREKTLLVESEARAQQVVATRLLRRCHAMLELQRRHIAALSAASTTSGASETNDSNPGSAESTSQSVPRRAFSPPSKGTKADDERLALLLTDVRAFTDAHSPAARRRGGSREARPQEQAKDLQAETLLRSGSLDERGAVPAAVETHQSPGTATTKTLAPPPTRRLGELVDESASRAASVAVSSVPTHRAIRHIGSFENIPGASPPPPRPVSLVPSTTSAAARYAKSVTSSGPSTTSS